MIKKSLFLFFLTLSILCASNPNYELQLIENLFDSIYKKDKYTIMVDSHSKEIVFLSDRLIITQECEEALVLIGKSIEHFPQECKKKPFFSISYNGFKSNENSFGAFYWRKGRPQIKFKKKALEKFNIVLPDSLKKYVR